jgi:hypothetical protein
MSSPPVALVQTWITLITSSESPEVKRHASKQLIQAFGDMETAIAFAQQHGLITGALDSNT